MAGITQSTVEAALDSSSAFGWTPEGRHTGKFVISKDSVPLGRAVRVVGAGVTAYDFDGAQVGPIVASLYAAGLALEGELVRRRAVGQIDSIVAQAVVVAAEIGV